ncbi:hypothetical protein DM860_017227 [Cuscuta australis]|uniref:Plastocyanin-like domain-containing protein n=1 Tax=Cuscuta australis TaxID=267555 RepID=A0A328E7R5_9ASTE|nr:hypothetical protein DM860_017227 [Cuscuta australis]
MASTRISGMLLAFFGFVCLLLVGLPATEAATNTYKFNPDREEVIVLGEWWHADVETLVNEGNRLGLPPNASDAHTINGKPGPLFPCSEKRVPNTIFPKRPLLPASNDTAFALAFNGKLRSLNTPNFPAKVPLKVDRNLFFTVGLGMNPCPTCLNGTRLTASLNNISFVMPHTALLEAHYFNMTGVYNTDFPDKPPIPFNYTGAPLTANLKTARGTRVSESLRGTTMTNKL